MAVRVLLERKALHHPPAHQLQAHVDIALLRGKQFGIAQRNAARQLVRLGIELIGRHRVHHQTESRGIKPGQCIAGEKQALGPLRPQQVELHV